LRVFFSTIDKLFFLLRGKNFFFFHHLPLKLSSGAQLVGGTSFLTAFPSCAVGVFSPHCILLAGSFPFTAVGLLRKIVKHFLFLCSPFASIFSDQLTDSPPSFYSSFSCRCCLASMESFFSLPPGKLLCLQRQLL